MKPIPNDEIRHKTLVSYDNHVEEYLHKKDVRDVERTQSYWPGVDFFLTKLGQGETIFEIGSGSGYDAQRIEGSGFTVIRSDASRAFIDRLREAGYQTEYYDVLDGPTPRKYAAIYANAVLLHCNEELFKQALSNIVSSLKTGGYLCIGMKLGDFEGWRNKGPGGERYFKYWSQASLRSSLEDHGFVCLNESLSSDKAFIVITAKKNR